MNLITHAIAGIAVSTAFMLNPAIVILGAVIPDIDYLIGVEHRTLTHSLIFTISLFLITWKLTNKKTSYSLLLGLVSHLILDSITTQGLPLFYPLMNYYSFGLTSSGNQIHNLLIITLSVIIIINKNSIHDYLMSFSKGGVLKRVNLLMISWLSALLFFPVITCPPKSSTINETLLMPSEELVMTTGRICSEINTSVSGSGNTYQIFNLCDETGNITVWKGSWVLESNLSNNDLITICGKFTLKYDEPELYYVSKVIK